MIQTGGFKLSDRATRIAVPQTLLQIPLVSAFKADTGVEDGVEGFTAGLESGTRLAQSAAPLLGIAADELSGRADERREGEKAERELKKMDLDNRRSELELKGKALEDYKSGKSNTSAVYNPLTGKLEKPETVRNDIVLERPEREFAAANGMPEAVDRNTPISEVMAFIASLPKEVQETKGKLLLKGKPIDELDNASEFLDRLSNATALFADLDDEAIGPIDSRYRDIVSSRDPKYNTAMQAFQSAFNKALHEVSGSVVTQQELERMSKQLGDVKAIGSQDKIRQTMLSELQSQRRLLADRITSAKQSGYAVPKVYEDKLQLVDNRIANTIESLKSKGRYVPLSARDAVESKSAPAATSQTWPYVPNVSQRGNVVERGEPVKVRTLEALQTRLAERQEALKKLIALGTVAPERIENAKRVIARDQQTIAELSAKK